MPPFADPSLLSNADVDAIVERAAARVFNTGLDLTRGVCPSIHRLSGSRVPVHERAAREAAVLEAVRAGEAPARIAALRCIPVSSVRSILVRHGLNTAKQRAAAGPA